MIPNLADAVSPLQARFYSRDLELLTLAQSAQGVLSGGAVGAQGSPDMTVAIAAGSVLTSRVPRQVTAGNATIPTADGTNPRIDLVVADATGAKQVRAGTPAADPVMPALTAGDVSLASVLVPAGAAAIEADKITDKRYFVIGPAHIRKLTLQTLNNSTALVNDNELLFHLGVNEIWSVTALFLFLGNSLGDIKVAATVPSGGSFTEGLPGMGEGSSGDSGGCKWTALHGAGTATARGATQFNTTGLWWRGRVTNGATAGTFQFQWAQNTAHASDLTMRPGSFIHAWKER